MRRVIFFLVLICFSAVAHAYRMPSYRITEQDWQRSADEVLADYDHRMDDVVAVIPRARLEEQRSCHSCRLSRREQLAYREYRDIEVPYQFWDHVVRLKRDLLSMAGDRSAEAEADLLAKKIIQKIYELSNEYKIVGSALIHNVLINAGARKKGFCYHYTDALRTMVDKTRWKHFAFHWGAAWNETFRENNGLVITAAGKPFDTGIVVDPWRAASKPYWHAVKGDRFPWKELHDVHLATD